MWYNVYSESIRFRQMVQGEQSKYGCLVDTCTICVEDNRLKTTVHFTGSDIYPVKRYLENILLMHSKFSFDIA